MVKNIPPHTGLVESCAPSETGVARLYNISGLRPDGIPHYVMRLRPDGIPHYVMNL